MQDTSTTLHTPSERPQAARRLWVYTNFDCNLACSYCLASSSPSAERRALPLASYQRLIDEASAAGIDEFFLTGGEPFLLPDITERLKYTAVRGATTVLTNGALLRGRRFEELRSLAGLPLTLQVSLDGHLPELHDAYRGAKSWDATVDAIRRLVEGGFRVTVGATETPRNTRHIADLQAFAYGLGAAEVFVRPLTRRGFSAEGLELRAADVVPELTVTVDGLFWHPQGAGEAMLLSREIFPLSAGLALMGANLAALLGGGIVPQHYSCA